MLAAMTQIDLLGVRIHPMRFDHAVRRLISWAGDQQSRGYVCLTAAHSLMMCREDARTRWAFAGSLANLTDGMPLVWLSRLKGAPAAERIYSADLMPALAEPSAELGLRHYFYGGGPGVPQRLGELLKGRIPGFQVAGALSPPFRPLTAEEDQSDVARINAAAPDIVWVSLGTGRQEPWMMEHREALTAPLLIGAGAAFDFLSGSKPQAPVFMQRSGLEWLFRLMTEPRRLWRRYAAYPLFTLLVLKELIGLKGSPSE